MAIYNAGNAYLQILPSFRGIEKLMQRETGKLAKAIDRSIAQGANDGLIEALRSVNVNPQRVQKAARETGDKWASVFEQRVGQQLRDAAASLPVFEPKTKLNRFDRAIAQTRKGLEQLANTRVGPTGDIGLDELGEALDSYIRRMNRLAGESKNVQQQMRLMATAAAAQTIRGNLDEARNAGLGDGRQYGGSFAEQAKAQLVKALRSLPEINLEADTTATDRAVADIRRRLESLSDMRIGVDIDRDEFNQQLGRVADQIELWARTTPSLPLRYDLDSAARGLRDFGAKVAPVIKDETQEVAEDAGEVFAGRFADTVKQRIAGALRALPDIELEADASPAEREIADIRARLESLSKRTVGVDIDAGDAEVRLDRLLVRLQALDGKDVEVDVRTNAAAAAAEIRAIQAAAGDSSVSMQQLGREAGITMSRIGYLVIIGASLGSIIAPAATTAAVAVAGIGTAALGAVAGFGALAFGVVGIADAVQKIDKYQQDADKSARSFGQAQNRVISALSSVKDAEVALANAREDAAEANEDAQRRIADAQRNVARAQRDAAESVRRARENERDAIADIANARRDAAEAIEDAIESQEDAQRSLTRANKDAKEAREELNQALKDAVQDLRELDTAVKRNANEIAKSQTDAMKAKLELDKILTNPRASEIEKRQAKEKYDAELIQIEELKNQQAELAKQKAEADKRGVESTDRVKQARERVADADERAADAQRRLVDAQERVIEAQLDGMKRVQDAEKRAAEAQRAVAKAQADGAERVADAQRAVADAQRDAVRTQRDGARSIASGQRRLADANRSLGQSYEALGVAGGDAFDNMQDALDNLSPAGRRFAQWIYNLKPYLEQLRSTAQNGFLPGLQDGLQILINNYLPAFDAFLGKISRGLGAMFRATAQVFTLPEWREFFSFIADHALPALQNAWVASLNLARGVANLIRALSPLSEDIGGGLVRLTERFARWSDSLENSPSFQRFLAYAAETGPKVVHLIGEMVEFIGRLVVAMAPIGTVLIDAFTATFEWINSWDLATLTTVVEIVSVLAGGILLLTGFVRTVKFVTELWNATSLITAKVQGIVAGAVARYNTATATAATNTGLLNGRMFAARGAGTAGAAGMAAMSTAAGPLGVAIAAIGGAWLLHSIAQQKADEATDELKEGLRQLGDAYDDAGASAGRGGSAIVESLRQIVANNSDMQLAVVTLSGLGIGLDTVAAAAAGNVAELDRVMDAITGRITFLTEEMDRLNNLPDEGGQNLKEYDEEIRRLEKMREKFGEAAEGARLSSEAMKLLNSTQKDVGFSAAAVTPAQLALAEAHRVLGDESATAQQKMDALKRAEDAIRQASIDAVEAQEQWSSSLLTLKEQVNASKEAHDKHATSLGMNTQTGLRNRDMLEQLITSANKMYDADVALNGVTQTAVTKGNQHIEQIRKLAKSLGLNEKQTNELIKTYNRVPENIQTAVSMDPKSFQNTYTALQRMLFMQDAAKRGLSPAEAERQWKRAEGDRKYQRYVPNKPGNIPGRATGGPIDGVGGPTSDSNLIWASRGEFMQPADSVNYYGPAFMEAVRRKEIPKELFPGFADGGAIGNRPNWRWPIEFKVPELKTLTMDEIFGGGPLGGAGGGGGYRWQMQVLRQVFPGLDLYSGYRPGSRTANGSLSWHARDGGRAVDVPPRQAVFNWIHDTYGKNTKELIWGGDPNRNIQRGKHHRYNETLLRQHGPYKGKAGPSPHIHWAYDQGGYLPPGYSTVFNGTGQPEPVLTAPQWQAMISDRREDGGPRMVYNIEFAENKLTLADLQAHERRQAALDRVGRPR